MMAMTMKQMIVAAAAAATMSTAGNAAVLVSVQEVTGNVVVTSSGTVDLSGLTAFATSAATRGQISPSQGGFRAGPGSLTDADFYTANITGPSDFGFGIGGFASSGSGGIFGLTITLARLVVPEGYLSGQAISSSSTYDGATFQSLGIRAGTYVFTLPNSDTVTLQATAVPEPATWAMLMLGFGMVGAAARRRYSGLAAA